MTAWIHRQRESILWLQPIVKHIYSLSPLNDWCVITHTTFIMHGSHIWLQKHRKSLDLVVAMHEAWQFQLTVHLLTKATLWSNGDSINAYIYTARGQEHHHLYWKVRDRYILHLERMDSTTVESSVQLLHLPTAALLDENQPTTHATSLPDSSGRQVSIQRWKIRCNEVINETRAYFRYHSCKVCHLSDILHWIFIWKNTSRVQETTGIWHMKGTNLQEKILTVMSVNSLSYIWNSGLTCIWHISNSSGLTKWSAVVIHLSTSRAVLYCFVIQKLGRRDETKERSSMLKIYKNLIYVCIRKIMSLEA